MGEVQNKQVLKLLGVTGSEVTVLGVNFTGDFESLMSVSRLICQQIVLLFLFFFFKRI